MSFVTAIKPFLRKTGQLAVKHAPGILMGLGTVESVFGLIFAVKAAPGAQEAIQRAEYDKAGKLSVPEMVRVTAKYYGPAVAMEALSLACFWGAHGIDVRRQAVLAGLATTAEEALREYQRKVQEMIGEKAEKEVRNAQAQDFVDKNPPPQATYILDGDTERDYIYKGQYFRSTYFKIKEAQNLANHEMIQNMYFTESELMWLLDPERRYLKPDSDSGMVGWNVDKLIELDISWATGPNHEPVGVVTVYDQDGYRYDPQPGFSRGL